MTDTDITGFVCEQSSKESNQVWTHITTVPRDGEYEGDRTSVFVSVKSTAQGRIYGEAWITHEDILYDVYGAMHMVKKFPLVKAKDAKASEFYQTEYLYSHETDIRQCPTTTGRLYFNRHSCFAHRHDMFQMSEMMFVKVSNDGQDVEVVMKTDVWVNDSWAMSKLHRTGAGHEEIETFRVPITTWTTITSEDSETHTWEDHYEEVGLRPTPAFTTSTIDFQSGPLGIVSTNWLDIISYVPETNLVHFFQIVETVDDPDGDEDSTMNGSILLDWEPDHNNILVRPAVPISNEDWSEVEDPKLADDGWHRPHGCSDCGIWQSRSKALPPLAPSIKDHCLDCTWEDGMRDPTNWVPRTSEEPSDNSVETKLGMAPTATSFPQDHQEEQQDEKAKL